MNLFEEDWFLTPVYINVQKLDISENPIIFDLGHQIN